MKSAGGASVGGSLLSGASGVIGSAIAAGSARRIAREQNAFNEEMWNKQNAYNTPQAQKQRLIDAGLNPALMYGNGGVQNVAESPQPASDAAVQSPNYIMDGVLSLGHAIGGAVKSALEAVGQNIDNKQKGQDFKESVETYPLRFRQQELTNTLLSFEGLTAEARSRIENVNAFVAEETKGLTIQERKNNVAEQQARVDKMAEDLRQSKDMYGIRKSIAIRSLWNATLDSALKMVKIKAEEKGIELTDQQILESAARIGLMKKQGNMFDSTVQLNQALSGRAITGMYKDVSDMYKNAAYINYMTFEKEMTETKFALDCSKWGSDIAFKLLDILL